jgi:hypothetical protein
VRTPYERNIMNKELKKMRNFAEVIENQIETTKYLAKKNPESPVDYDAILKAQYNCLSAIHERICFIVIKKSKFPFWMRLFMK